MPPYHYPSAMRQLVSELSKLPSIGEKSALRLAYHLLNSERGVAEQLAQAICTARERTKLCVQCFSLTEVELCSICSDNSRNHSLICVVEKPADVLVLERSGGFGGLYHVLHGLWSPLRGINPDQTKIRQLIDRISIANASDNTQTSPVKELILATSTTVEGDATALFIANAVREFHITLTRIAQGLPKGGELEYADEVTLSHAIEGRQDMS